MNLNTVGALPLDFIDHMDLATAGQYSKVLPAGKYLGLLIDFAATYSSSISNTILGSVKVNKFGRDNSGVSGDIVNVGIVNLQILNNLLGGLPKDTAGTAAAFSCIVPFGFFGYPNALYSDGNNLKMFIDKAAVTCTTFTADIYGIFGNAPQNYIPIIQQDRINSLGGISAKDIKVNNLIALLLKDASTTNPTSVVVKTRDRSAMFSLTALKAYTDLAFNVESASLGVSFLNLLNTDISDALNDEVRCNFSGGNGYLDYIAISAVFDKGAQALTRQQVETEIRHRYQDNKVTPPNPPETFPVLNPDAGG